jgi:hypothetical protein
MIAKVIGVFSLSCVVATTAVAQPTTGPSPPKPPSDCTPQPECRIVVSPLTPGAPGFGIRDKALTDPVNRPLQQPKADSYIQQ